MTKLDKWDRIYAERDVADATPPSVLVDNLHLLARSGRALDLACGLGGAAITLARRGFEVTAWDQSATAIDKLRAHAAQHELPITAERRDVAVDPLPPARFDVIVVANFLLRDACREIARALQPGGLLLYETASLESLPGARHKNPDYCLRRGELLELFHELHPVVWREEALLGELELGSRGRCTLVAQARPPAPPFFVEWCRKMRIEDEPDSLARAIAVHRPRIRQLPDRLAHLVSDDPSARADEWGLIDTEVAVIAPDSCPPALGLRAIVVLKADALLPSDLAEAPLAELGVVVELLSEALARATGAPSCRVWTPHPDGRRSRRVHVSIDSGVFVCDMEEKRRVWARVEANFAHLVSGSLPLSR